MPTEEIVILGNTRAGILLCVGGLIIESGLSLRLRRVDFPFCPTHTEFRIGKCFTVSYEKIDNAENPHHVEDAIVHNSRFTREMNGEEILMLLDRHKLVTDSEDPRDAFRFIGDTHPIQLDGEALYIPEADTGRMRNSIGFWRSDRDLRFHNDRYFGDNIRVKYVGRAEPIDTIKSGSVVRLSTSQLWKGKQFADRRSYVQLSGWFA